VKLTLKGSSLPIQPFCAYSAVSAMPGHRRRQRERQVDQRIDDALGRELVAHQHPGDDRPNTR
jgi:hypothetical protein